MELFSDSIQYLSQETLTWDRWFQELDQLHLVSIHHYGLRAANIDLRRPVSSNQNVDQHIV